jgi:uncharacterized membrane protein YesL
MKVFSLDSKFTQVMTSGGEMMLLNLCWILASVPIVTIGAANAAMYTVMGRRLRQEGSGTIAPFFKAWWSNLKQGSLLWVVQLLITGSLGLIFFMTLPVFMKVIAGLFLFLVTVMFSLMYPQIARFRIRWFPCLRNAVILTVTKLRWVLLNLLVILAPVIFFLLAPVEFARLGFVWILFGFSALFYLSARILRKVLQPLEDLSAKAA